MSYPLRNCIYVIKTRPPLIIFMLCLMILSFATLIASFWVNKQSNPLLNSDQNQSWLKLTGHLSQQSLCKPAKKLPHLGENPWRKVAILIKINTTHVKDAAKVVASYEIDDKSWYSFFNCEIDEGKSTHKFQLEFNIPKVPNSESFLVLCGILSGPQGYIPIPTNSVCDNYTKNAGNPLELINLGCDGDNEDGKIRLDLKIDNNADNFHTFLSEDDRNVIYVHLMWTSSLLIFCLLIVVLYAMFHPIKEEERIWSP